MSSPSSESEPLVFTLTYAGPEGHEHPTGLIADDATKRWCNTQSPRGGRAQILGFIVDLVRQYTNDRPVYRGLRLETWQRELADHEHTLESIAAWFKHCLSSNFGKETFEVRVAAAGSAATE